MSMSGPDATVLHRASRLAAERDALRLTAEKLAQSYLRGPHGRRRTGQGENFWQFRPYHAGDAPRTIDWRQTAKRDDVFVREREHDAAQALWLWCDRSPSMDYTSGKSAPRKVDFAETVALAAGLLALEGGERVGVIGTAAPARSHASAAPYIQALFDMTPPLGAELLPTSSRGICLVLSDFYTDLTLIEQACAALHARDSRIVLVQVCDRAEEDLPWHGRVRFEGVEGAPSAVVIDDIDGVRAAYHEKFFAHRTAIAQLAARHGGVCLVAMTDEPAATVLGRVIDAVTGQQE